MPADRVGCRRERVGASWPPRFKGARSGANRPGVRLEEGSSKQGDYTLSHCKIVDFLQGPRVMHRLEACQNGPRIQLEALG
jgi:hypothetical protein